MKFTVAALMMAILASPAFAGPRTPSIREAARQAALTETVTPAKPRQRSWVERHPVVMGTVVGAGIGASVGALTCKSPISDGDCDAYTDPSGARYAGMAYVGAWGAGIGALAGLVASVIAH